MNIIYEMKQLIQKLTDASVAYYKYDSPIMSDKEYDELYDELCECEKNSGVVLAGSPTHKVQGYLLDGFKKVKHSKPMLSAAKTKDINEIRRFLNGFTWYCSYKLDGLTLVLRYSDGKFIQGITRGNGDIGEDVTDACRFISNIPMTIPHKDDLEVRGECVVSWDEFNRINDEGNQQFSHPRNMAAGTLRQLDMNVVKNRHLSFVLFEVVTDVGNDSKSTCLDAVERLGFETVFRTYGTSPSQVAEFMENKYYPYPCDGLIFEIDSRKISEKLGKTDHHESCRMALKWKDDLVETTLRDIEWSTSKTGVINPVAVFDEVDLGGALTTRATLHNITYIKDLKLGIGDTIEVYRANLVIPKVHSSITKGNNIEFPRTCPVCGSPTSIVKDNDTEFLYCTNNDCPGKLLGKWKTFVSRKGMNINGLSEATLEKFLKLGYLTNMFVSIYELDQYKRELYKLDGFGKRSIDNLLEAIENSKNVDLQHFITAFSIDGIGEGQSKILAAYFGTFNDFMKACDDQFDFSVVDGIGSVLNLAIHKWWMSNHMQMMDVAEIVHFKEDTKQTTGNQTLAGLTFVITGKVYHFSNREELKDKIESLGGKVAGSVSKNTDYLINNDITSTSGKNKKAKELGVKIITEDNLLEIMKIKY